MNILYHPDYHGEKECIIDLDKEVPFIKFTAFSHLDYMIQGFSTRLGGVSKGYLASLNLSYSRGDDPENVDVNYERICQCLGVSRDNLVFTDQVHSKTVVYADGSKEKYTETDGLITDKEELILTTTYADCVPLFLVDEKNKCIGSAHSGWRGTVAQIGRVIVEKMTECFGSDPSDLIAVIGPSICKDCYEVSEDVMNAFREFLREEQIEEIADETNKGTFKLDLWKANQIILKNAGLSEEKIHIAGLCTCCNSDLLFSHRASMGKRGNLNGFLGIKAFHLSENML